MENPFKEYVKGFSEHSMWQKIGKYAKKVGQKTVYTILLLYFAYKRKDTPLWAKNIIIGTIGYFISPIDILPDLTPIIGYTDDIGVLSFGLVTIASYVNSDVKDKARIQLKKWFKNYEEEDLKVIDKQL